MSVEVYKCKCIQACTTSSVPAPEKDTDPDTCARSSPPYTCLYHETLCPTMGLFFLCVSEEMSFCSFRKSPHLLL